MEAAARRRVRSWDIFCKVVDNFGDAGVCFRLARQIAAERGDAVRLWIDDPAPLVRMWPEVDPALAVQRVAGVEVRRWDESAAAATPHDVVIEAFGCDVPDGFAAAMAVRVPPPAWINLEYLSAEDWVETHHRLPSPHPRLPLTQTFFFPGFTPRTGGLLREAGLLAARDAFQQDVGAPATLWRSLGLAPPADGELRVSLFAYPNPAAGRLFEAWANGAQPVHCVVPDGIVAKAVAQWCGHCLEAGRTVRRGNLALSGIPFVRQPDYDRLLWACAVNFVRGEDSFVRAQWAGRPLVWHIYPQDDAAHRVKLAAFLDRYLAGVDAVTAAAVRTLFEAWNGVPGKSGAEAPDVGTAWARTAARLDRWEPAALAWADRLAAQPDLLAALADTIENGL